MHFVGIRMWLILSFEKLSLRVTKERHEKVTKLLKLSNIINIGMSHIRADKKDLVIFSCI